MTQYPLGRIVQHDPRSLNYQVEADGTVATASWTRHTPILDQGQLGSCTGNAGTGLLGTDPYYATTASLTLDETYAVQLYSDATKVDDDPQNYPPTDTGSSGLAIAKVLTTRGLISGYTHITSLAGAHTAIQHGPFMFGSNWYQGMFDPDDTGLVTIGGSIAGGHEYELLAYDATTGLWKAANSWGASWGDAGYFTMSDATLERLLTEDGDGTVFTPDGQPAPVPTPAPVATETPTTADTALHASISGWVNAKHTDPTIVKVVGALKTWDAAKGWQ